MQPSLPVETLAGAAQGRWKSPDSAFRWMCKRYLIVVNFSLKGEARSQVTVRMEAEVQECWSFEERGKERNSHVESGRKRG